MKYAAIITFAGLIFADSVFAANWQTPYEAQQFAAAQTGAPIMSTAPAPDYFQITATQVNDEVRRQLQAQGMTNVSATLTPNTGTLYSANHPLTLALQALQIDREAGLWQAQAYILSKGHTETVKPVSGRFELTRTVPVLTRPLRAGEIIESSDLSSKTLPERQLHKDTITETQYLVGQTPARAISPGRPIRTIEVAAPTVVKKGDLVEMNYTTPYMSIRTTGEALENGSSGSLIRVKNSKSNKAVSARVAGAGRVEVNTSL